MNELQLGLIGLGVCGVAGVFVYNKWQENRHRRLVERSMPRAHADVLLDDAPAAEAYPPAAADADDAPVFAEPAPRVDERPRERVEPVLSLDEADGDEIAAPDPVPAAVPAEAAAVEAAMPAEPAAHALAAADDEPPEHLVSPVIDYIAAFELVEAVSGEQILASQQELLARVAKPIARVGLNDRSGHWERIAGGGAYRRLRLGLLLADRRGPLGEADLLTFHGAMLNIADALMAVADMPPRDSVLAAAIALDRFCAEVDIQVGINVIGKGQPFPGTKIRALAEAAGMVLDSSGRFVRCDEEGHALYTLASQEAAGFTPEAMKTTSTHGLVFLLDVPRVGHGDRAFAQMLELARRMAETLNGTLVDDNRRPLTESMLDPFRRQIGQYQSQLAAKGLPAGGPLALRLFA